MSDLESRLRAMEGRISDLEYKVSYLSRENRELKLELKQIRVEEEKKKKKTRRKSADLGRITHKKDRVHAAHDNQRQISPRFNLMLPVQAQFSPNSASSSSSPTSPISPISPTTTSAIRPKAKSEMNIPSLVTEVYQDTTTEQQQELREDSDKRTHRSLDRKKSAKKKKKRPENDTPTASSASASASTSSINSASASYASSSHVSSSSYNTTPPTSFSLNEVPVYSGNSPRRPKSRSISSTDRYTLKTDRHLHASGNASSDESGDEANGNNNNNYYSSKQKEKKTKYHHKISSASTPIAAAQISSTAKRASSHSHNHHNLHSSSNSNNNNTIRKIDEEYELLEQLGSGTFSIVHRAKSKINGDVVAVKILKIITEKQKHTIKREIDIMKKLEHPNIVALYNVYAADDKDTICLAMEFVDGGELFDEIVSRGTYSEIDASGIIRQVLEAANYMHNHDICHRDLKPENILLCGKNKDVVKVTDFGVSKDCSVGALATFVGTPDYMAPEVLRGHAYTKAVDLWAIGVITYVLLAGCAPFNGKSDVDTFQNIITINYQFDEDDWDGISDHAKVFVKSLLVTDDRQRPSAAQLLSHPWIALSQQSTSLASNSLPKLEKFKTGMKFYNNQRKKQSKKQST